MEKASILMIHEMREEFFDLPLHDYILTFDDGLYSQYYYFDRIKNIDTEKIFFISTDIVAPASAVQSTKFPKCSEAHDKYFNDQNSEDYMTWSQIREIASTDNCCIGGHSHAHQRLSMTVLRTLIKDIKSMCREFNDQLGYCPTKFCFPYNESSPVYEKLLSKYGFRDFYSDERVDVYDL